MSVKKIVHTALPQHARRRILVVNDSVIDVVGVVGLLASLGYTDVTSVTEPRYVMPTLSETRFDAMLVDLRMPLLDGLMNIYLVREAFTVAELPILSISDAGIPELRNAALFAGANDHICRPIDPIDVGLRLRNLLVVHDIYKSTKETQTRLEREIASRTARLKMLIERVTTRSRPQMQ